MGHLAIVRDIGSAGEGRATTQEMIDRVLDWPTISAEDRARILAALRGAAGKVHCDQVGDVLAVDPGRQK